MKSINLNEVKELTIEDDGRITLDGKVIEAVPIGKPFHIDMRECITGELTLYNVWQKTREELARAYLLPDEANAFVFGNSLHYVLPEPVGDIKIVPIQLYKITE